MSEDKDKAPSRDSSETILEPIGIRIIGDKDPGKLSEEQFRNSPDILFHGAMGDFKFTNIYDYRSPDYYEKSDGSQTLGEGFYTTEERDVAENYSIMRQSGGEIKPVVTEVLPYQAKVLDLRSKFNPSKNAPVPEELFDKWVEHFTTYYKKDSAERNDKPWHVNLSETQYFDYLILLKQKMPDADLRIMLGTAGTRTLEIPSLNYPSPPWMKLFSNFMVDESYDGLVYNEGGEGKNGKNHTSYIFYNLKKVGTFESWQESKSQT